MLNFGVIGTNWISKKFISATQTHHHAQTVAVFSRRQQSGQAFKADVGIDFTVYDQLESFLNHPSMNVVYIASPNHVHFDQIMMALKANKHVLVEKPAVISSQELRQIQDYLREHPQLYFMEAVKQTFFTAFHAVEKALPEIGHIIGANLNYLAYDESRIQFAKQEPLPSVLSARAARGVLYDLGVYLVHNALRWFGEPLDYHYKASIVDHPDGADYFGVGTLIYDDYQINFSVGNHTYSELKSEIYGDHGTVILEHPTHLEHIKVITDDQNQQSTSYPKMANTMMPELDYFINMVQDHQSQKMWRQMHFTDKAVEILENMRQSAHITFN